MSDKLTFDVLQKILDATKSNRTQPPILEPYHYFGSSNMCERMKGKGAITHIITDEENQ